VFVLGLGVAQQYNEMHLLPEPLFSIPTDGVHIMNIEATQHGRIFMAGKDGCLYELAYQVRRRTVFYMDCTGGLYCETDCTAKKRTLQLLTTIDLRRLQQR